LDNDLSRLSLFKYLWWNYHISWLCLMHFGVTNTHTHTHDAIQIIVITALLLWHNNIYIAPYVFYPIGRLSFVHQMVKSICFILTLTSVLLLISKRHCLFFSVQSTPVNSPSSSKIPTFVGSGTRQKQAKPRPVRKQRNVIQDYRPGYTWNRGGRVKELRIR